MKDFIIRKVFGKWINVQAYKEHLQTVPDGNYLIRIESTKKRSSLQNSFYWAVVVPLVYEGLKSAGFDAVRNKDDAHEVLKSLFLKVKEEKNGIVIEKVLSTAELKTVGFIEYLQNISIWAFDYLGVTIPEPGQTLELL